MSVQTIVIGNINEKARPTVRLGSLPHVSVWQFAGAFLDESDLSAQGIQGLDLNCAVERAAIELAKKVSGRQVKVEVVMEPLMPRIAFPIEKIVPLIQAIGENASASVEPGPGKIVITTWWKGKHVGVDAVGIGGSIPLVIKNNIMNPGFTTRAGEWDTGFGLYHAGAAANDIGTQVELFEDEDGIGFRLAIPLRKDTPASSPDISVGLSDEYSNDSHIEDSGRWSFEYPILELTA